MQEIHQDAVAEGLMAEGASRNGNNSHPHRVATLEAIALPLPEDVWQRSFKDNGSLLGAYSQLIFFHRLCFHPHTEQSQSQWDRMQAFWADTGSGNAATLEGSLRFYIESVCGVTGELAHVLYFLEHVDPLCFHGTNGAAFRSMQHHALTNTSRREAPRHMDQVFRILHSGLDIRDPFGVWYKPEHVARRLFFATDPFTCLEYAQCSPEWFQLFLEGLLGRVRFHATFLEETRTRAYAALAALPKWHTFPASEQSLVREFIHEGLILFLHPRAPMYYVVCFQHATAEDAERQKEDVKGVWNDLRKSFISPWRWVYDTWHRRCNDSIDVTTRGVASASVSAYAVPAAPFARFMAKLDG